MKTKQEINEEPNVVAPPLLGSCRLAITSICCSVSFASIVMTINLSMAIVCMNDHLKRMNGTETSNCSSKSELNGTLDGNVEIQENEFHVDKPAQGMLLGGLYYGVVAVQLLVGWLCDRYGKNKLQMAWGTGLLAISSFLTPVILQSGGVHYYFVLRIFKGIFLSFSLSSMLPLLTRWTTTQEQGLLVGISSAGVGVANSVTYPISGFLCKYGGWKLIFYFGGICGLVATLLIVCLVYDSPTAHPRINVEEKQYLLSLQLQSHPSKNSRAIPWRKMLLSLPVWSVVITHFFFFAVVKGTVLNLPIFIKEVLDFTITENGIFSAMPLVGALILHLISGPMFDYVRTKQIYSTTTVRKLFHAAGTLAPSALMFVASQLTPEHKYIIISLVTIGYSFTEFAVMGGYCYTMMDLAPDFVGILQGINKTVGLAPGFIIPVIIAALTPHGSEKEWGNVFILFGALYVASCFCFLLTGSAKLQKWSRTKDVGITVAA